MTERAWLYGAVSSAKQAETIKDQLNWGRAVAQEHGWPVTHVFSGVATGKAGVRRVLDDLLNELRGTPKDELPRRVLMIRIDRVGRGDALGVIAALHAIYELGVMLHTQEDGDVVIDSASSAIKPILRALTSGTENETRVLKATSAVRRKRAAGEFVGKQPFGFVCVNRRLVLYEPEAALVREIFQRKLRGWGSGRLARWVATLAPAKKTGEGTSRPLIWSETTIRYIIRNTVYRGTLVSEETFDAALATRGIQQVGKKFSHRLRGALVCSCGRGLYGRAFWTKGRRYCYYGCRSLTHPTEPLHRAADVERSFMNVLRTLTADPSLIAPPPAADITALFARKSELHRQVNDIERRKSNAWNLAEDGTVSKAELSSRLDELNAQAIRLKEGLATVEGEIAQARVIARTYESAAQTIARAAEIWESIEDPDEASEIARAVAVLVGGLRLSPEGRGEIIGF